MRPASSTSTHDRFPVHSHLRKDASQSLNCSLSIYFSGPICAKFDDSIDRSFASITCIRHKMKRAATWTDAQAAQRRRCKQVAFLPAFLIFSPTDVARWIQRGSNCRERPRRQKILSLIMPDFLPGASVQKRASQCTLSSVYLGRSNKKIEFL